MSTAYTSPKVHALIFVNNGDRKISHSVEKDGKRMKYLIDKLSRDAGLKSVISYWDGKNANLRYVRKWINNVPKTDLLFFFYSGHGMQVPGSSFKWPIILDPKNRKLCGIDITRCVGTDRRLAVVIMDCCNSYAIGLNKALSKQRFINSHVPKHAARNLLLDFTGTITASSSSPGERSFCCDEGSIFTNALLKNIIDMGENYSWNDILSKAGLYCIKETKKQTPMFEILHKNQ